jgi:hypothetical protein
MYAHVLRKQHCDALALLHCAVTFVDSWAQAVIFDPQQSSSHRWL